jgi:hypothetical protein
VGDEYQTDPATVQATSDLADAVPALRPILNEHTAYHGEVLPHVVWAEFRHELVELVESGDAGAVTAFLDVVERLAGSPNDAVRNVVEIAFLEDGVLLGGRREQAALTGLVPRFGPVTRALLAETKRRYEAAVEASRRDR